MREQERGAPESTPEPGGRSRPQPTLDRSPQALQGVNRRVFCKGCHQSFTPVRATQQHCKPSCRVLAYRRRQGDQGADLLASGIAAGHVEPDVAF